MKVALVYDRLNKIGGAERVLVAFHDLFPTATWYTSVWDKEKAPFSRQWQVISSFLSLHRLTRTNHEYFPLLMPFIFEAFDFSAYDLVISIGSAECKGIITKPKTLHLHYCLTPTRYLYSHTHKYLSNPLYRFLATPLRAWDQVAATRPDEMIAISTQVKKRIQKYYKRNSDIIYPPVDVERFARQVSQLSLSLPDSYFLVVSRLVAYKQLDLLISAFKELQRHHLVIAGIGKQFKSLTSHAPDNVHFLGSVAETDLPALYQGATAYLQANEEDFGLSMVEAQAAGIPVIAYGSGGALDIVLNHQTGILLPDNRVTSFVKAIDNFDHKRFDREACYQNAKRFDISLWQKQLQERIATLC